MATKTLITTFGQRKIAQALANEDTIEVTAMVFGDGDGSQYTATVSQTQLKNQLYSTAAIAKVEDETWTYFEATIPESVSNFTIREIGLTCINDDTGQNELIIIATVPDTEKVVSENGVLQTMPIRIGVTTSIGTVITIVADPDSIPPFTNNNLGLIKGKNSDGYVQAKDGNTGFGSVVGWDNVFKKVSSTPQTINSDVIVSLGNTLYYKDSNNIQRTIIATSSNTIQIGNNNNLLNLQGSNLESSSTGLKIKSGNFYINTPNNAMRDIVFNNGNSELGFIRFNNDTTNNSRRMTMYFGPSSNPTRILQAEINNTTGDTTLRGLTDKPNLDSNSQELATTHFVQLHSYGPLDMPSATIWSNLDLGYSGSQDKPEVSNLGVGYLPSDYANHKYMVYVQVTGTTGSTSGNYFDVYLGSSKSSPPSGSTINDESYYNFLLCTGAKCVSSTANTCRWGGWVPVNTDGRISIRRRTSYTGTVTVEAKGFIQIL